MANKSAPPRGISIHYTKQLKGWLPGFVEEISEATGKAPSRMFIEAFCEKYRSAYPELWRKFNVLKRLDGGE
jgi:hypothetical protein